MPLIAGEWDICFFGYRIHRLLDNGETHLYLYGITKGHIVEIEREEFGRNLLVSEVKIYRNEVVTYELDMDDYSDNNARMAPELLDWKNVVIEDINP